MPESKDKSKQSKLTPELFRERYLKELARRPQVSDEEFMAETEVSDEQYALGLTILVSGIDEEVVDDSD